MADDNTTVVELVKFTIEGLSEGQTAAAAFGAEVDKLLERNKRLASSLSTGAFGRQLYVMREVNREYAKLNHQANLSALVADHGRLGAVMRANEQDLRKIGRAATIGYGATALMFGSLIRTGLQGTVEGHKMELAYQRLGRSVAGIAVPALDKLTHLTQRAANAFQSMDGTAQDALLTVGLIGLAGPAIGRIGAAGIAGGRAIGRVAQSAGAIFSGGGSGIGAAVAEGGAFAATSAATSKLGVRGALGGAARYAPPVALAVGAGKNLTDDESLYHLMRNAGHSKLIAGWGSVGGNLLHTFGVGNEDKEKAWWKSKSTREVGTPRKDPTIAGGEFSEAGGAWERIQQAVLQTTDAADQGKELKEAAAALKEAAATLKGGTAAPESAPPPSIWRRPFQISGDYAGR